MRARRWRRVVVGVVAAGLLVVSCGNGEESSAPTTRAATTTTLSQMELDRAKAQRIVLTAADVPGFTVVAPDPSEEEDVDITEAVFACMENDPLLMRMDEDDDPRGASSPEFEMDEMTVGSSATLAETPDEARLAFTRLGAASFPGCFSEAATDGMRSDPSFTNVRVTTNRLPALTLGDETVGYRSVLKATYEGTPVTVYLDYTFVRSGRTVAVLESVNAGTPFPDAERRRLAALIAGRMAGP